MTQGRPVTAFIPQSQEFLDNRHAFYEPLRPDGHQIRLMHIKPGALNDRIDLELSTVDLEDKPVYEALSYTWESLTPTKQVYIHGFAYEVTVNQHRALRRLRWPDKTRLMWMDVICIDQAELGERSHQVSIMGDVYSHATVTIAWLGDLYEDWDKGLSNDEWHAINTKVDQKRKLFDAFKIPRSNQQIELMSEFQTIQDLFGRAKFILSCLKLSHHITDLPWCIAEDEELHPYRPWYEAVQFLEQILQRPWWQRVWVLQETFLCQNGPILLLGSHEIRYDLIKDASKTIGQHLVVDKCCMEEFTVVLFTEDFLDRIGTVMVTNMLSTVSKPGQMSLDTAVHFARGREASDTRDYIYGTTGLAHPSERIEVDYTLTTGQLFTLASWEFMHKRDKLTYLSHGGLEGDKRTVGIPSWSIDWVDVDRLHFRFNYTWQMDEHPDWKLTRCNEKLEVFANEITRIFTIFERIQVEENVEKLVEQHALLWSWITALAKTDSTIRVPYNEDGTYEHDQSFIQFFSTLLRDTTFSVDDLFSAHMTVRRLLDQDWQAISKWWNTLNKLMEDKTEPQTLDQDFWRISTDLRRNIEEYTLAFTSEKDLCLVPENSVVGDTIYHVRGCCPPLVLRASGTDTFKVVGAAYLKGSMGSEGWKKDNEKVIILE